MRQHKFKGLTTEEYEELFSNYIVDSWSYSKVSTFSRNEKAFEMSYVYRIPSRKSATTIAGNAYHEALDVFFKSMQDGNPIDIVKAQQIAYSYIEEIPSNDWKLQKTTPTVDSAKLNATKTVTGLIDNFFKEINVYEIKEVLAVEVYCDDFLTINGVDIPLPCHARVDLLIKTIDDKTVIIDHKSKKSFTDDKEVSFVIGKQAVTYYHSITTSFNIKVDEVWFIENKFSKNRDKSPQLKCFKFEMTEDNIRLFDALLYEPLKRMIDAVSDPDYLYLINENDNFIDKAEIHLFWSQTMIAEVDDFNIPDSKKDLIKNRLKKVRDASIASINPKIITKFRKNASEFIQFNLNDKDMSNEEKIEYILRTLGVIVKVARKFDGYSSDTFLLEAGAGTNLSSISRFKLDIANALNVSSIIIKKNLYVHEGKSYLAIESPKKRTRDLFFDPKYLVGSKIPIGLDNFNSTVYWDIENQSTPHVLICGATGSGKSVAIISILEFAIQYGIKDIVIFDPKFEFTNYSSKNIKVYNDIEEIEETMEVLVEEMNSRVKRKKSSKKLILFDEFADALSSAKKGKDLKIYEEQIVGMTKTGIPKYKKVHVGNKKPLEENLRILLQKGRSLGYRIIAATQRASVKVITGDSKVNFPVQICFRVPKEVDSKVVLDEVGAETLAGKGDGLVRSPEYLDLVRFQSFYKK